MLGRILRKLGLRRSHDLPSEEAIIRQWIAKTGLTKDREQDYRFYLDAYNSGDFRGDHFRKRGTLLDLETKKALGVPTRSKFSAEYLDTLSEKGRIDPVGSAWMISAPANQRIYAQGSLKKISAHSEMKALFYASNMAAGPCPRAAAMDNVILDLADAPLVPFDDCPHPDQCACFYGSRLDLE